VSERLRGLPLPPGAPEFLERLTAAAPADPRVAGVLLGGSVARGGADAYSDLDVVLVCRDKHASRGITAALPRFAASIGSLLSCFRGDHVGHPELLISLYGPEKSPVVVWQRDEALAAALATPAARAEQADRRWIEDRFWVWVHYIAAKVARGELLEALDGLALLRARVLGPLIAERHGRPPNGTRRLEQIDPELARRLGATVGATSARACLDALDEAVRLYEELRIPEGLLVHAEAAEVAKAYVAETRARLGV
jgi:predicted nucleotidyltransferase